jgi:hypothetical protein
MMEIAGRRPDPCVPLVGRISGYDKDFLQAIDTAMQIHPGDRLQSAAKWKSLIFNADADALSKPQSDRRAAGAEIPLDLELSLSRLVNETNDEVRRTKLIPVEPEPTTAPPDDTPKPAWIEEFNQEIVTPAAKKEPAEVAPELFEDADPDVVEEEGWSDTRRAYLSRRPAQCESYWVDRALEKHERIRSKGESQSEISEAGTAGTDGSTASYKLAELPDYQLQSMAPPENTLRPKIQLGGVLFGLLICFGLFAFLNALDEQKTQAALITEVEGQHHPLNGGIANSIHCVIDE